ncbi:hypothetical protein RRG08_045084 [Elysia crispata]|uniref:Uncharacterized protein n=1 Tax=Elysia crispata TaxID=231223 RepID=A0AAE1D413_9GAST|nr:hypothetical protein RRG08_045084 [Elysia crispata]
MPSASSVTKDMATFTFTKCVYTVPILYSKIVDNYGIEMERKRGDLNSGLDDLLYASTARSSFNITVKPDIKRKLLLWRFFTILVPAGEGLHRKTRGLPLRIFLPSSKFEMAKWNHRRLERCMERAVGYS